MLLQSQGTQSNQNNLQQSPNVIESLQLVELIYRELADTKTSKAEALRRTTWALLQSNQYQHPIYWTHKVLVGNWL